MASSSRGVTASLGKLDIDPKVKSKKEPAESWEDEADESCLEPAPTGESTTAPHRTSSTSSPAPPPPTPSASTSVKDNRGSQDQYQHQRYGPLSFDGALESVDTDLSRVGAGASASDKRPEKTTAVASRMIAAGLGQKAPRRTAEQREYDQAMKLQETKRRDQAKAEEEKRQREREQAKRAIWDD